MPFVAQPAVVVDLETTGANPALDRITEVGVLQIEGGEVVREWSSLVNPGTPIPPFIAAMTGITDAMVAAAPTFRELRHELWDLLRGRIFVAHNARFDFGFLAQEFGRADMDFREPVLCSVKLSRRLWPQHRSHGLDAIIARHGIACVQRHRALGDARALWEFLRYVRAHVPAARVAQAVEDVMRQPASAFAPVAAEAIPVAAGVYRFYGEDGALLYVGKCGNLRARVMAYFSGTRTAAREAKLARQVRHVDWIETAGELGAWLVQRRLIAAQSPRINRAHVRAEASWFLRPAEPPHDDARLVEIVDQAAFDAGAPERHYGLFRSRRAALQALHALAVRHRLCPARLGVTQDCRTPGEPCANPPGCALCAGAEPVDRHRLRLMQALLPMRLAPWPFGGRVGIREHDAASGRTEIHVVDRWRHLGTARSEADLEAVVEGAASVPFDADCYRLFTRVLLVPGMQSRVLRF